MAESRGSLFGKDRVDRGVAVVAGVKGVVAIFCRLDLRGAETGELCSWSAGVGEGLESSRAVALRFFDRAAGFDAVDGSCWTFSLG